MCRFACDTTPCPTAAFQYSTTPLRCVPPTDDSGLLEVDVDSDGDLVEVPVHLPSDGIPGVNAASVHLRVDKVCCWSLCSLSLPLSLSHSSHPVPLLWLRYGV
jgi:hypothetical protein